VHHRSRLSLLALGAVLVAAAPGASGTSEKASIVRVRLALVGATVGASASGAIEVTSAGRAPVSSRASAPGQVEIAVTPSAPLRLVARFPGWLSDPFELAEPVAEVTLRLKPAATIEGRIVLPAGESAFPPSLELLTESPPKTRTTSGVVTFEPVERSAALSCPLEGDRFSCLVPAGLVNFSLRAKGYQTAFFWNRSFAHSGKVDLGTIALVRGASLVGWAVSEAGPAVGAIVLTLEPAAGGFPMNPATAGLRTPSTRTRSDGFFEFLGVAPGGYQLVARLPGFEDVRHEGITIVAGSETRLREPLVLYRPTPFEVQVSPPTAPDGSPWRIGLKRLHGRGDDHRAAQGRATASGSYAAKGLTPGLYRVEIRDTNDNLAHSEETRIEPRANTLWISMRILEIHGTLRRGSDPLLRQPFALVGVTGAEIRLRSDDEGRYEGYVPEAGSWGLLVGEGMLSGWRMPSVTVRESGKVDLQVAVGRIRGTTVDDRGQAVAGAMVSLAQGERVATRSDESGAFELQGLEPGAYKLVARSADRRLVSKVVETRAAEADSDAKAVLVTLHPGNRVTGTVESAAGPLSRAQITVCGRASAIADALSCDQATVSKGTFAVTVAQAAEDVVWFAQSPGYALEVGSGTVADVGNVTVGQEGATVVLRLPRTRERGMETRIFLVQVGTGAIPMGMLYQWAGSQGEAMNSSADETTLRVPMLEPGRYALCDFTTVAEQIAAVRQGQASLRACSAGVVAPFGEITLTLPGR
jgi:hypothetical protein